MYMYMYMYNIHCIRMRKLQGACSSLFQSFCSPVAAQMCVVLIMGVHAYIMQGIHSNSLTLQRAARLRLQHGGVSQRPQHCQ